MRPRIREAFIATVAATSAAAAVWFAGATAFRGLYDDDLAMSLLDHTLALFRIHYGTQVIENGMTVRPKDAKGPQMGPRRVILRGSVATIYRAGELVRVEGPGKFWTRRWEYVAQAHSARPKLKQMAVRSVLTGKDRVPITISLNLIYGLALPDEIVLGQGKIDKSQRALLSKLDLGTPDIEARVLAVVEQEVRQAITRRLFDQITSPAELGILDNEILNLANARLEPEGLRVRDITITEAAPAQEVLAAASQAQAEMILELTRAYAWHDALIRVAGGYRTAKGTAAMSDEDIKREVLRRVLDALARAPKEANSALSANVVQSLVNGLPGASYMGAGPGMGGVNSPGGPPTK